MHPLPKIGVGRPFAACKVALLEYVRTAEGCRQARRTFQCRLIR